MELLKAFGLDLKEKGAVRLPSKDFGHLKVMPAADSANSNENQTFQIMEGYPCAAGGLLYFYYSLPVCG